MTQVVATVTAQINRALAVLKSDNPDFKSVTAALVAETMPSDETITPAIPAKTTMTEALTAAVAKLPAVLGRVQPTTLRELTEQEVKDLYAEQEVLTAITKTLETRTEAVKQTIRVHMSLVAARTGEATNETEMDDKGFPIVGTKGNAHRFAIPGTGKEWSLERVEGSVSIDVRELEDLLAQGQVSREEYLALTRQVRVFDEKKAMAAIEKDPSLLGVLKLITRRGRARQSLYVRNPK